MKSKKLLFKVALVIGMVLAFSFQASAAGTKWRLQHSWGAAENHFFENFAKIVNEMSGGEIEISVYADGELVSWDKLCDAVGAGTLEMGHTHPDYYQGTVPVGELESAPYLWRTMDEEMAVIYMYGLGDVYKEAFEKRYKYKVLGFQADDCGAVMFTKEVNSLKDMKGLSINILDPYATILNKLAGAASTYLGPEELYTALSRKVIQGVEYGGAKAMYDMSLHEVAKYFLLPRHQVAYFPFYFINQRVWEKLPADQQAILVNAVKANTLYMRSFYAQKEPQALNEMVEKHGVKITHLPEKDINAVSEKTLEWLKNDFASKGPYCKKAADICIKALKDFGRLE
ncbi:MAG: TRAP transporter substrate-binding protein DctP [Desulfotignum sp.]|nr:TRAP transporter substrate-binding protein DctP [Desulfotignum sp.]